MAIARRATLSRIRSVNAYRHELQQLINRHNKPQQIVLRAKIILMAINGKSNREIASYLRVNRHTVSLWRNRWLETDRRELLPWHFSSEVTKTSKFR